MSVHTVFPVVDTQPSEIGLKRELFFELDKRAREIETQLKSTWVEFGDLCATIKNNELWREGGYSSFGEWLMNACPTSRSYAYLAMGILDELKEIPVAELRQMPLGNADILKHTPKAQRGADVLEAAKAQPPREFLSTVMETVPDAHLESRLVHKFRLTASAGKTLRSGLDMWRILNDDPDAPAADALEGMAADYMLKHQAEYEEKLSKV